MFRFTMFSAYLELLQVIYVSIRDLTMKMEDELYDWFNYWLIL